MRIRWTRKARRELQRVGKHLSSEYGARSKERLLQDVFHVTELLSEFPHLGPVEPSLAHRTYMYRSIVVTPLNKIIYTVHNNAIEIIDFWDTRRDPAALADQIVR